MFCELSKSVGKSRRVACSERAVFSSSRELQCVRQSAMWTFDYLLSNCVQLLS